jgi:hypothetical protein
MNPRCAGAAETSLTLDSEVSFAILLVLLQSAALIKSG